VNFPHSLVIFGPFVPDHQLNTSARKVVPWSHGARLALERSARDVLTGQEAMYGTSAEVRDMQARSGLWARLTPTGL
jgi:hypothetical protein